MREILFRGKRVDNGAWVEGAFCLKDSDDPFGDVVDRPSIIKYDPPCDGFWFRVDPETLGQFTGLTDKNGKKIFEGDVVRCIRTHCDGKEMVGHIVFADCCFCVKDMKTINRPAMDLCGDFEVISNIHDNPELLEDKQ